MTTRFKDHILVTGTLAARPAATAVPAGTLYPATDTGLIYRSDGATWATWATLGGAGTVTSVTAGTNITVDSSAPATPVVSHVSRTLNAQTGTTYTLVLGDAGKFVTMTNAAASTLTVPPNSSVALPVGAFLEGAQLGAGQVTLTPGAGVTINATPGLKVAAQYGTFGLLKTATDTWLAYGRLAA